MKKLNRKGFTLVELLAVIIILAIVVGITIPTVLTTTNNTKKKAFDTAANTAADWIDRQYTVAVSGLTNSGIATLDGSFSTVCGAEGATCSSAKTTMTTALITAAGLKTTNIASATVYIDPSTGRSCVTLTATNGADYPNGKVACGGVCNTGDAKAACTSTNS